MAPAIDSHEECCHQVCILCYGKGKRSISDKELKFIQDKLINGYQIGDSNFPARLCEECNFIIGKALDEKPFQLTNVDSYAPQRPLLLRSDCTCNCKICKVAKIRFRTKGKRGRPKNANDDPSPVMPNIKICSNCFSIIGKGLSHICSYKRAKVDNIQKLLHTTPTSSQRVASRIIKDSATPLLSTLGELLPVNDFQIKKKQLFSVESMSMIQKDLNLSNRKVLTLAEDLRTSSGSRKVIEKGMKEKLRNLHNQSKRPFQNRKKHICL